MIIDKLTEFCDATSVAKTAGSTYLLGNQVDLGIAGRDPGNGKPVYLVITVDTSIITGGSAGTLRFILASDDSASIATDGGATEHWRSQDFVTDDAALNALDAGARIVVPLPSGPPEYERYLGLLVEVTTTDTTAGAISAFLTLDPTYWKAYADAQN